MPGIVEVANRALTITAVVIYSAVLCPLPVGGVDARRPGFC